MKYIAIFSILFISIPALAESNTPIVTATNFYEALKSNNIGVARTLIVNPDNLPNDGTTSFDIKKYYFFKWNAVKNIATVKTSTVNKNGTISFNTILENKNGKWKVNFNKTILNMARGAIKKKQVKAKVKINIEQK